VVEPKDLPPELQRAGTAMPAEAATPAVAMPAAELPPGPMPATTGAAAAEPLPVLATAGAAPVALAIDGHGAWLGDLEREARRRLEGGEPEVWDALTRQFEGRLIHTALEITRGRRIEAAQRLGIGRNTITRKIQELGLDD
jgi:two-component system nitrogen regulation response regulator GlnG